MLVPTNVTFSGLATVKKPASVKALLFLKKVSIQPETNQFWIDVFHETTHVHVMIFGVFFFRDLWRDAGMPFLKKKTTPSWNPKQPLLDKWMENSENKQQFSMVMSFQVIQLSSD